MNKKAILDIALIVSVITFIAIIFFGSQIQNVTKYFNSTKLEISTYPSYIPAFLLHIPATITIPTSVYQGEPYTIYHYWIAPGLGYTRAVLSVTSECGGINIESPAYLFTTSSNYTSWSVSYTMVAYANCQPETTYTVTGKATWYKPLSGGGDYPDKVTTDTKTIRVDKKQESCPICIASDSCHRAYCPALNGTVMCINEKIEPCCGDKICSPGENSYNCIADCGPAVPACPEVCNEDNNPCDIPICVGKDKAGQYCNLTGIQDWLNPTVSSRGCCYIKVPDENCKRPLYASCLRDSQCASDLKCIDGKCQYPLPPPSNCGNRYEDCGIISLWRPCCNGLLCHNWKCLKPEDIPNQTCQKRMDSCGLGSNCCPKDDKGNDLVCVNNLCIPKINGTICSYTGEYCDVENCKLTDIVCHLRRLTGVEKKITCCSSNDKCVNNRCVEMGFPEKYLDLILIGVIVAIVVYLVIRSVGK